MDNTIPLARGLGSSAAATVAGVVAANALMGGPLDPGGPAPDRRPEIEGHPDNAAASLLGGFVVAAAGAARSRPSGSRRRATFERSCSSPSCDCRPTRCARRSRNPCRSTMRSPTSAAVAIGVAGMAAGRTDLLRRLTVDRLHEPYRAAVYPQLTAPRRGRARGRRARGLPVGRRLDDPRLRRLDGRHRPHRRRVQRRGRRHRPARPDRRRRAAQRRARRCSPAADRSAAERRGLRVTGLTIGASRKRLACWARVAPD